MMRGSYGGNQGMGGGSGSGGGGGGGWLLRRVASAVSRTGGVGGRRRGGRATVHKEQPFSPATPDSPRKLNSPKIISLSSPTSSSSASSNPFSNLPLAVPSSAWPASFSSPTSSICDEFEWINEDERFTEHGAPLDDFVFGSVPSQDEVQSAVTALQQVFDPGSFPQLVWDKYGTISDGDAANFASNSTGLIEGVHSFGSDLDWIEPSVNLYNSRMMQPRGPRTLYDAFNLLQSESSIQRMVVSLSSDKAVWNAVLNNEVVQELRESLSSESESNSLEKEETSDSTAATSVLMWILDSTTAKAKDLIEMIVDLANHLFQPHKPEKTAPGAMNSFEEKLRSSLLLTVVVLLVVVVARVQRA